MKINKFFLIVIFFISIFSKVSLLAEEDKQFDGKGGRDDLSFMSAKNNNFKKGKDSLKQALKYERKNKIKKANKKYEKALAYLVSAYQESPSSIEVINLLGFTYYKLGDFIMTEIYYHEALKIDPKDPIVNQRLGELYFITQRAKLAEERLSILSHCNCQEYLNLKKMISSN